jgi:hypothetical protein
MSRSRVVAGIVITALGVAQTASIANGSLADDGLEHSVAIPVSGLLNGTVGPSNGYLAVTQLAATTGDEVRVPPQDMRGRSMSFYSPRREAKGIPQRNVPRRTS